MAAATKVTLQARNAIVTSTGSHNPGAVFKCSLEDAAFLLKKGAAVEIKGKAQPVKGDSPEKIAAKMRAEEEKKIAEEKSVKKRK